jgi:hypothetical protein
MPFVKGPDGALTRHHTPGRKRNATDALDKQNQRSLYPHTGDRESSPDKRHVSFGRKLERGPSPAYSRIRTTPRPTFVRNPTGPTEPVEIRLEPAIVDESDADSPSYQLWAEEKLATKHRPSGSHEKSRPIGKGELNALSTTDQPELKDITDEAQRDDEVCRRVHELRTGIVNFARGFADEGYRRIAKGEEWSRSLEVLCSDAQNAQLIRYVGCLAQGGPDREASWRNMMVDHDCRIALVSGIIGTALKEHVFSELWFSGTDEQIEELETLQEKQKNGEGQFDQSEAFDKS